MNHSFKFPAPLSMFLLIKLSTQKVCAVLSYFCCLTNSNVDMLAIQVCKINGGITSPLHIVNENHASIFYRLVINPLGAGGGEGRDKTVNVHVKYFYSFVQLQTRIIKSFIQTKGRYENILLTLSPVWIELSSEIRILSGILGDSDFLASLHDYCAKEKNGVSG